MPEEGHLVLQKGLPAFDGSFPDFDKTIPEVQPERGYLVKGKDALDLFPSHAFTEILQWREEQYDFERIAETAPQIYFRPSEKVYLEFVPFSKKAAFSHLKGSAYKRFQEIFKLEE